ncbi:MAG TPA: hypothetical protein VML01_00710 [Bryobacterales bacterium]|nr:hypothetical protein [Bryobacterales bacterium]
MAYLAPIKAQDSQLIALPTGAIEASAEPGFSPLEWSVIRLARTDRLWTIGPLGRVRRFWNWLIGRGNPQLANPRLEALRRISVLSWHFGFTIASDQVADFVSAGFSLDQYELLVSSVSRARGAAVRRQSTEVLV